MRGKDVPGKARQVLNAIDEKLTTQALYEMNTANIGSKKMDAAAIAEKFVKDNPVDVSAKK